MFKKIYIEREALSSLRAKNIITKYPKAELIECEYYGEIFNKKNQSFRLQKQNPALIIAVKKGKKILTTPEGFGIGGGQNYYFSHMLNCVYDCRYCFLQGMYNSAYFILFVNYEDFFHEIKLLDQLQQVKYFFSGYDCDSLALEKVTNFAAEFIEFFQKLKYSYLELRSKSVNIAVFDKFKPTTNIINAYSFTPAEISAKLEHKTPPVRSRIKALKVLAQSGWQVGVRLDPLIYNKNYQELYDQLISEIFTDLPLEQLHSVSVGPLRFPKNMHSKIQSLYPKDSFLVNDLTLRGKNISYEEKIEKEMENYIIAKLQKYIAKELIFSCKNF
ncbi:MAG: SPL family radical SAM protein [Rickettsiales bacterium]